MVEEMASLRSSGYVDPGWEHGIAQDERKKKVKCNYCGKIVSGGIFRLKQHLARLSGEVTHCEKVPEDICLSMRNNLEGCRSGRKRRHSEYEQGSLTFHSNEYNGVGEASVAYKQKGKKVMTDKNLVRGFPPLRALGYVDPGWEHCVPQDEKKKRVKCNYCEKIISGGINRFKQHLARIPGEVAYCEKAPEDVYLNIKENMKWHRTGRRPRKPDIESISTLYMHSDNENEEEEQDEGFLQCLSKEMLAMDDKVSDSDIRNNVKGRSPGTSANAAEPKRSRLDSIFLKSLKNPTSPVFKKVRAKMICEKKTRKEVLSAISKFFYHAGIPSNAANSPYFHKMLDLVGQYGQGLKGPFSRLISGRFLQDEITTIKEYLTEFKASWAVTGCSIVADSWKDVQGRTLINFLASCPRGLYFVSSIDATDIIEDASNLFKLLDKVVEEMGEESVVQVISKNTASFKTAGKMLEEKRKNLFWTPCAVYCIDEMLEDFLNIKQHPEVIRGLNECIVRLEPDNGKRISASMQIPDFVSAKADFGTDLAISTRTELDPAAWWQQHGISCLELQHIAIRILSQTCSSFGCEHTWSTYDQVHSRRRNCLSRKRWNELTYVHYNLRLRERQLGRKPDDMISFDSAMPESILDDWIVETEKQALNEDEEILYNEMEHFYGDENENEIKRAAEMVTSVGVVKHLDINPAAGVVSTDDDTLDFIDDGLTD
uniref:BED-type domain-containing protein n=1 Tax=Fagus sylvatica TaxID=28930 RepID=A0A2N9HKP9_FAGSY